MLLSFFHTSFMPIQVNTSPVDSPRYLEQVSAYSNRREQGVHFNKAMIWALLELLESNLCRRSLSWFKVAKMHWLSHRSVGFVTLYTLVYFSLLRQHSRKFFPTALTIVLNVCFASYFSVRFSRMSKGHMNATYFSIIKAFIRPSKCISKSTSDEEVTRSALDWRDERFCMLVSPSREYIYPLKILSAYLMQSNSPCMSSSFIRSTIIC